MSPEQLAASCTLLAMRLTAAARDLVDGRFTDVGRHNLADDMADLARDLRRTPGPNDFGDSGGR